MHPERGTEVVPGRVVSWPDWRQAEPGTRVRHVRSGATGTFVKPARNKHNGAIIDWDPRHSWQGDRPSRGHCVAPAFDMEPIT